MGADRVEHAARAFMFTDIENSTFMWEHAAPEMSDALRRHDELVYEAVARAGGRVAKHLGDGVAAVFPSSSGALNAAIELQKTIADEGWSAHTPIRVRVGIHHGVAEERGGDFFGRAVNCAARIADACGGGQILISRSVREQLGASPIEFRSEGFCALKGISQPVELLTVVAPGLVSDAALVEATQATDTTIPLVSGELIGRADELRDIERRLAHHRMVTLVGPPGAGKTRLAVELADRAIGNFPDGVHVVELAAYTEQDAIDDVIAVALLGVDPVARSGTAIERMQAALADKTMLLVLDNCEHLPTTLGPVVRLLLSRMPRMRIIATSRQALGVMGEQAVAIGPLLTDVPHGLAPAQQLFLQRARQARPVGPDFDPQRIAEICDRLDGLPLALELAAARLNVLSLDDLSDRLATVLGKGRRQRNGGRHDTLEGAIEWSWLLLDSDEQLVLARASTFAAPFELDAAMAVCAGEQFDAVDVIDLVSSLRDASFIAPVYDEDDFRFRVLQVIREFATARAESSELEEAARRHQEHFLKVTAPLAARFDTKPDADLIDRLERDDANFVAALRARPGNNVNNARKLAMQLHTYWEETGRLADGYEHTRQLLDPTQPESGLWRAVLGVSVSYAAMTGHLAETQDHEILLGELVAGEPDIRALNAYFALGFVKLGRAELDEASTWFEIAGDVVEEFDPGTARQALMTAGACHAYRDDPHRALELYARAKKIDGPEQSWFAPYHAAFEASALVQVDPGPQAAGYMSTIDRGLSALADLGLGFRVTVAVHQSAVAFELADAVDLLGYWWPVGLRMARNNGHRWAAALSVEIAAWASARSGDEAAAARHWAVADGAFSEAGYVLPEVHRRLSEIRRADVRERMGADQFDDEYQRSSSIDLAVYLEQL